jgi:ATPase subunit of ABC transporter with duplicated ATPase domains
LVEEQKQHQAQIAERTAAERLRNQLLEEKREADDVEKHIAQLENQSSVFVSRLSEFRDERFRIRREIAGRLNAELKPTIRISIRQEGGAEEYRQLLEDALSNSGIKQRLVAQKLTRTIPPAQLAALVRDGKQQALVDQGDLNAEQAAKVVEAFRGPVRQAELLTAELRDNPRIELLDGGTFKDSAALSTGQKCTTILPILLLESENPLLIDQPEDNLDNRFIFETVVANLQRVKASRQLILVTHNPNVPVLGEAAKVVVMDCGSGRYAVGAPRL